MKKYLFFIFIGIFALSCNSDDDNSTIENNCDSISKVISEEDFKAVNTSNYVITEVEINKDCLKITFGSSGCDPGLWKENLYSADVFYNVHPLQRAVKMELINDQLCEAVFQKSVYFNLIPFQIDGQQILPLNIDGWNEQIIYEY